MYYLLFFIALLFILCVPAFLRGKRLIEDYLSKIPSAFIATLILTVLFGFYFSHGEVELEKNYTKSYTILESYPLKVTGNQMIIQRNGYWEEFNISRDSYRFMEKTSAKEPCVEKRITHYEPKNGKRFWFLLHSFDGDPYEVVIVPEGELNDYISFFNIK